MLKAFKKILCVKIIEILIDKDHCDTLGINDLFVLWLIVQKMQSDSSWTTGMICVLRRKVIIKQLTLINTFNLVFF